MDEQNCNICKTHEVFEKLKEIGYDSEQAFHLATTPMLVDAIEKAVNEGYETGHNEGYAEATNDLAIIVGAYAETVNNEG